MVSEQPRRIGRADPRRRRVAVPTAPRPRHPGGTPTPARPGSRPGAVRPPTRPSPPEGRPGPRSDPDRTAAPGGDDPAPTALVITMLVGALGLGAAAAWSVDPADAGPLGVLSSFPVEGWVALVLTALSLGLVLGRRRTSTWLLAACVVVTLILVDLFPLIASGRLGTSLVWIRAGLVDLYARPGGTPMAAGSGWPGGLVAVGALARSAGLGSARLAATLAPLVIHAALIPPTLVAARRAPSRAVGWTAAWLVAAVGGPGPDALGSTPLGALLAVSALVLLIDSGPGPDPVPSPGSISARTPTPASPPPRAAAIVATFAGVALTLVSLPSLTVLCVAVLALLVARHLTIPSWVPAVLVGLTTAGWVSWSLVGSRQVHSGPAASLLRALTELADVGAWGGRRAPLTLTTVAAVALVVALAGLTAWGARRDPVLGVAAGVLALGGAAVGLGEHSPVATTLLFALPLAAPLAARTLLGDAADGEDTRDVRAMYTAFLAAPLLVAGLLVHQGTTPLATVRATDLSAATWIAATSPREVIVTPDATLPWEVLGLESRPVVVLASGGRPMTASRLNAAAEGTGAEHPLILLTVAGSRLQEEFGNEPADRNARLARDLMRAGGWEIAYEDYGSVVLRRPTPRGDRG